MRLALPFRALLPLVLACFIASCNSEKPFVPEIESTTFDPSLGVDLANSTRTASGLYYRDITVGGGTLINATGSQSVTNTYSGALRNGDVFDSGSFTFTTGISQVIAGFDEGVRGMRQGGRRQIIIPPNLGYGSRGSGPIPANSILVFDVTVTLVN
ncbi:MAG: FKBP-type peptidyl-prolyl cis-trans isomerase [Gemmatimonadaceae bacterium]